MHIQLSLWVLPVEVSLLTTLLKLFSDFAVFVCGIICFSSHYLTWQYMSALEVHSGILYTWSPWPIKPVSHFLNASSSSCLPWETAHAHGCWAQARHAVLAAGIWKEHCSQPVLNCSSALSSSYSRVTASTATPSAHPVGKMCFINMHSGA